MKTQIWETRVIHYSQLECNVWYMPDYSNPISLLGMILGNAGDSSQWVNKPPILNTGIYNNNLSINYIDNSGNTRHNTIN